MLVYVFWHWRMPQIDQLSYQEYLIRFHQVLSAQRSEGFLSSRVLLLERAPWLGREAETYEDWYFLENSAALDPLNVNAINGQRKEPHDRAARWAEGGTAGLYSPRFGDPTLAPRFTFWFAKPAHMSYTELYDALQPLEKQGVGTLWQRQMTLGPAAEFCFHSPEETALPDILQTLTIPVDQIYTSK
ncbi:MAG: hypothetical protein H0U76_09650 [Ktedonobacteraceae bacterium]|nr:hypothetical protein [Ktedonobacteraceae bacterium]